MCLGVPHRVIRRLDADTVLVQVGGGTQRCFTGLVEDVREGDWLLVHAGFAVQRIGEREARANLELIEQLLPDADEEAPS